MTHSGGYKKYKAHTKKNENHDTEDCDKNWHFKWKREETISLM